MTTAVIFTGNFINNRSPTSYWTTYIIIFTTLSLSVFYDAYLKFQKKPGLYKSEDVQSIIIIIRLVILLITIGFFINSYRGIIIAKQIGRYNYNLLLQLISSFITILPAIIAVYVAFNSNSEFVQSFNPET